MSDDQPALLASIVADPADDTARLVYADCIEEQGNSTRAEFIRLQIEAERLHPDSNARARMETRAEAIFAEHWIEWWAEVCDVVMLPMPAPKPVSRLGRYARRFGLSKPPGKPYTTSRFTIRAASRPPVDGWQSATFRRGFPDTLELPLLRGEFDAALLALSLWHSVSPLISLHTGGWYLYLGPHHLEPYLASVRTLTLSDSVRGILNLLPSQFPQLEDFTWISTEYADRDGIVEELSNQVIEVVDALRGTRLNRLALQVWTDETARAVASAEHLSSLIALDVDILPDVSDDRAGATRRLTILARSPHLVGLKSLTIRGRLDSQGLDVILRSPNWSGLEKLDLSHIFAMESTEPFAKADCFPNLSELRLEGFDLTYENIYALVLSPLLKQLRHFSCSGHYVYHAYFWTSMFLDVVNPDRIETYLLPIGYFESEGLEFLAKFGDRFRHVP